MSVSLPYVVMDGLFPPEQYSPVWLILGLVLLGLLAGAGILIVLRSRAVKESIPKRRQAGAELSHEYLAQVDQVLADYARGQVTVRGAHARLSEVLRSFVHRVTGIRALQMTLTELAHLERAELTAAMSQLYEGEFGAGDQPEHTVQPSAEKVRAVIATWN